MIIKHGYRAALLVLTLGCASAFAETNATSGAASAHGVSANLLLDLPVPPDVTATLAPVPAVSGSAPPDFNLSQTAASASLSLGSLGTVLSTGVLTVTASSALASNQTNASATTNGLSVTVDPAGALPTVLALNATEVRATATAQCVGGNVTVSGTTTLVGAQLSVLNAAFVGLASNPTPNTVVPIVGLAGVSIILNEQIVTANQITVNAIHIRFLNLPVGADFLTGDIIVSQAVASLTDCVVAGASANLSIVKTGPASVAANGQLTYQIVITNSGPNAANGAVFQDPAVANFTVQSVSCTGATGGAVCPNAPTVAQMQGAGITIPTLPAGGTVTFDINGTSGASGTISNTATIATPPGVTDPDPNDNSDTETTPITPAGGGTADLSIVKTAQGSATAGGQMSYQIIITNNGPNAANGAVFRDPAVANFTATGVSCTSATGGAVCPTGPTIVQLQGSGIMLPTLPSGGSLTFLLTGTVGQSGTITNVAFIAVPPGTVDPTPGNNSDPEVTPISPSGVGTAISVPALDRFGLALMILLFAAVGWRVMHRQDV